MPAVSSFPTLALNSLSGTAPSSSPPPINSDQSPNKAPTTLESCTHSFDVSVSVMESMQKERQVHCSCLSSMLCPEVWAQWDMMLMDPAGDHCIPCMKCSRTNHQLRFAAPCVVTVWARVCVKLMMAIRSNQWATCTNKFNVFNLHPFLQESVACDHFQHHRAPVSCLLLQYKCAHLVWSVATKTGFILGSAVRVLLNLDACAEIWRVAHTKNIHRTGSHSECNAKNMFWRDARDGLKLGMLIVCCL